MRPTIKSLQTKIDELKTELSGYEISLDNKNSLIEGMRADHTYALSNLRTQLNNAQTECDNLRRTVAVRDMEIRYLNEVLRVTRELLQVRTQQATSQPSESTSKACSRVMVATDLIEVGGQKLSLSGIEKAAKNMCPNVPFVGAIKYIREKTGLGLKAAKDICDEYLPQLRDQAGYTTGS